MEVEDLYEKPHTSTKLYGIRQRNLIFTGVRTSDHIPGMNFPCIVCGKGFRHYVLLVTLAFRISLCSANILVYNAVAIFRANYVRGRIQPDIRSHNNYKGGRMQEVSTQCKGFVARPAYWAKSSF